MEGRGYYYYVSETVMGILLEEVYWLYTLLSVVPPGQLVVTVCHGSMP